MSLSRAQIDAELRRRGVQIPEENVSENTRPPLTRAQIDAELKRRGVAIPVEQEAKGFKGILHDAGRSGAEFFRNTADILTDPSLPKRVGPQIATEIGGALSQLSSTDPRAIKNVVAGLAQGGHGVLNTPANIADYLARKDIISSQTANKIPRQEEHDFASILGLGAQQKPGDKFLRSVTEMLPYVLGGEAGLLGRGVMGKLAQRSGAVSAHAVGQNEDPIKAALALPTAELGIRAPGMALRGARRAYEALTPSSIAARFTPDIPINELMQSLRTAQGTQTPLGDVLRSPTLKKGFENAVAPMMGSGADDIFTNIARDIGVRGEHLVGRLSSNPANSDPNFITKNLLMDAQRSAQEIKNNLWNTASETARNEGFNLTLPTFDRFIEENRRALQNAPLLSKNPNVRKMYNSVTRYRGNVERSPAREELSPILSSSGNPIVSESIPEQITYPSIREAKLLANELESEATNLNSSTSGIDRSRRALYRQMASHLRRDVQDAVNERGSFQLRSDYGRANDYHREEFSDFLDRDIFPLTRQDKSGQSIVREIIKPGKYDKYEAIQKVNNLLPENQQELLGFSYLLDAFDKEGVINPNKISQLVSRLGPRQFQTLYSPETQEALLNYGRLVNMNKEPINRLFNPHTGKRSSSPNDLVKVGSNIFAAMAGASAGGLIGSLLGPAALAASSNVITRMMTSPEFRERVVGKKIRSRAESARDRIND